MAAQIRPHSVTLCTNSSSPKVVFSQKAKSNLYISKEKNDSTALSHNDVSRSLSSQSLSPNSVCDLNRVHEELEKLNIATDVINKLELQLDEARSAFREIQSSWSQRLEQLSKKLGACIEKSRPYYEARLKVQFAQQEAQRAALRFERANGMHSVAKQQVALTQESLDRQGARNVEPACLEVLNHHIQRVNEAEIERLNSEQEHQKVSRMVAEATSMLRHLEQELKRSVKKSKPYFDARSEFSNVLTKQKELIQRLEAEIKQKKADYNTSLRNLESISEQIHEQRQQTSGHQAAVVAAERSDNEETTCCAVAKEQEDNISMPPSDPEDRKAVSVLSRDNTTRNQTDEAKLTAKKQHRNSRLSVTGLKSGGIILLAQELSAYDWIQEETRRQAFQYPPHFSMDDLDVRYQTTPEGVKPWPTPPDTPASGEPPFYASVRKRSRSASPSSSSSENQLGAVLSSGTSKVDRASRSSSKSSSGHKFLSVPSPTNVFSSTGTTTVAALGGSSDLDKSDASSLASFEKVTDDNSSSGKVEHGGTLKDGEILSDEFEKVDSCSVPKTYREGINGGKNK